MKLSHILPLVVGSAAAILASTSPSYALSWNLNNLTYQNTNTGETFTATGSFDFNGSPNSSNYLDFQNVNIVIKDSSGNVFETYNTSKLDNRSSSYNFQFFNPSNPLVNGGYTDLYFYIYPSDLGNPGVLGAELYNSNNFFYYLDSTGFTTHNLQLVSGTLSSTAVPFNMGTGGATIPSVGALLALGAMRKARKSIASKTRLANPVCASVS